MGGRAPSRAADVPREDVTHTVDPACVEFNSCASFTSKTAISAFVTIDIPVYPFIRFIRVNSAGQIAGTMAVNDGNWPRRGFIYAGGVVTPIDEEDADSGDNPPNTWVTGLDDALRVVGYYVARGTHGFVLAGWKFITVDVPNSDGTYILGSNTAGVVVGFYYDLQGGVHGFMAAP